jgi:hypothetical protein
LIIRIADALTHSLNAMLLITSGPWASAMRLLKTWLLDILSGLSGAVDGSDGGLILLAEREPIVTCGGQGRAF